MNIKNIVKKHYLINKVITYVKHYGIKKILIKVLSKLIDKSVNDEYECSWKELQPDMNELAAQRMAVEAGKLEYMPKVSILVPVYDPPVKYFREMLLSVKSQTYFNWQLCIVDAGNNKFYDEIKNILPEDKFTYKVIGNEGIAENTNKALELAKGEYIALLDNDDVLAPDALYEMVKKINEEKSDCVYSDEDKVNEDMSRHFCRHDKPDFNQGLLMTNNYICHLFMVKTEIAKAVKGFSKKYDGAQDFDFILKCTEKSEIISHVPKVLYHWRTHEGSTAANPLSKKYAYQAGKEAIKAHLKRTGKMAKVEMLEDMGFYKIRYELKEMPEIKIVVTDVSDTKEAHNYFKYVKKATEYDNYSLCAMKYVDKNKLEKLDCEYLMIINAKTKFADKKWLRNLCGHCTQEQADAVVPKLITNSRLFYAGVFKIDNRITDYGHFRKPSWYKGRFNRANLKSNAEIIPNIGIFVKKEVYMEMLEKQSFSEHYEKMINAREYKCMYEPNVIIKMCK